MRGSSGGSAGASEPGHHRRARPPSRRRRGCTSRAARAVLVGDVDLLAAVRSGRRDGEAGTRAAAGSRRRRPPGGGCRIRAARTRRGSASAASSSASWSIRVDPGDAVVGVVARCRRRGARRARRRPSRARRRRRRAARPRGARRASASSRFVGSGALDRVRVRRRPGGSRRCSRSSASHCRPITRRRSSATPAADAQGQGGARPSPRAGRSSSKRLGRAWSSGRYLVSRVVSSCSLAKTGEPASLPRNSPICHCFVSIQSASRTSARSARSKLGRPRPRPRAGSRR